MLRRPTTGLALGALLLSLTAACASPEPRHSWARGERVVANEPDRPRPPRVQLFISPAGEPFRGANGLAAWFAGADTDRDGSLRYAEFEADAMRFFKVLDANHDGVIDAFEIQAYERERVPEIGADALEEGYGINPRGRGGGQGGGGQGGGGRRGGDGGGGGGGSRRGGGQSGQATQPITPPTPPADVQPRAGREGAARFGLLNEPQPVANADEDVDGRVSLTEWKHATQRRFDRLDRAKTGKLILSDLLLPPGAKRPGPPPPAAPSH
jgi:hypothetical protein